MLCEYETVGDVPADCPVTETTMYLPLNGIVSASLEDVALAILVQDPGTVARVAVICPVQEYHW